MDFPWFDERIAYHWSQWLLHAALSQQCMLMHCGNLLPTHRFFLYDVGGKKLKSKCRQLSGRNLRRSRSKTSHESSGYRMPIGMMTHSQV
jgi:hypothetical protein